MATPAVSTDLAPSPAQPARHGPSLFYRAGLWRLGLGLARTLPLRFALGFGAGLGSLYGFSHPRRYRVVRRNLLPLFPDDPRSAERATRRLFGNFGRKLVDLMRFEAGVPILDRFVSLNEWDRFAAVHARGQGVLMLTPHLGNWEIGAPLLINRGVELLVITGAEPGEDLTALRQRSRTNWGIETLVVGRDPFAFVEIIKRLEQGITVAMLMDRPPASNAVEVQLCGQPFAASVAPAELARASGCALTGVYVVDRGDGYSAHVLEEIPYNRRALGQASARHQLTQEIMSRFEPVLRRHADQWYHFVPVWGTVGEPTAHRRG